MALQYIVYPEKPRPPPRLDIRPIDPYYGAQWDIQVLPRIVDGQSLSSDNQIRLPSFRELFEDIIHTSHYTTRRHDERPLISEGSSFWHQTTSSRSSSLSSASSPPALLSPTSSDHSTPPISPLQPTATLLRQQRQQRLAQATTTSSGISRRRKRHFNKKYNDADKLFIVYHKEDLQLGWRKIRDLRLAMLPVLLGADYDRSVEDHRTVSGLDGRYYRENGTMPVLAGADGSRLVFAWHDGWWECVRSAKCRPKGGSGGGAKGCGENGAGGTGRRLWGMVERYPEDVVLHWDKVRCFVGEDKREEVLARAQRYSAIRARQRRQHDVPQWTPDNLRDRAVDVTEPGEPKRLKPEPKTEPKTESKDDVDMIKNEK